MRQRVSALMDAKAIRGLSVSTFHALGLQILRHEADAVGLRSRFSILSADDARGIVQDLSASADPADAKRLMARITLWKNSLVSPDAAERDTANGDVDGTAASRVCLLSAAKALLAANPTLFEKRLWSEHGPGDAVAVTPMNDDLQEAESVAIRLAAHRFDRKTKWSDYAVLYRGNHQARVFEEALRREKIPYVLSGGQSFFERSEIRDLMAWMRLVANEDDDPAFVRAVTVPKRGVGTATLEALGDYATKRGVSLFEAACESGFATRVAERQLEPVERFTAFVNRLRARAEKEPAGRVLDDLLAAIDYRTWLFDQDGERAALKRWQNVVDFVAWIGRRAEEDGKTLIEATQSVTLLSMLDDEEEDVDAVRLSTLHAAKGLEFAHVFLVGVEEGLLPHKGRGDDDPDDDPATLARRIEEERRLMYVGVTRAQRSLSISWCRKRRRARDEQRCEPSRFIAELALDAAPKVVDDEALSPQQRMARLKALLATPRSVRP